jgi:hypothetical protein
MTEQQQNYIELLQAYSNIRDIKALPKEYKVKYHDAMKQLETEMTSSEIIEAIYKAFSVPHKSLNKNRVFSESDLG